MIGTAGIAGAAVGAGVCYLWLKNSTQKKFSHLEMEAKAKAKAISNEAELLLQESQMKIKTKELEHEAEFQKRLAQVEERNRALILEQKGWKRSRRLCLSSNSVY